MSGDLDVGGDGLARCRWGGSSPEYCSYHDEEWGRPTSDDDRVFEIVCLEGFQAGLSWLTILRKRAGFRRAFAGFEAAAVAAFGDEEVARLVDDPGIVRHRGKILAAIANAQATVRLRGDGGSLGELVWAHAPPERPAPVSLHDLPAATPESTALSRQLRQRGFRFVGPTTMYATMQALGVVNDHLDGCAFRAAAEQARQAFLGR